MPSNKSPNKEPDQFFSKSGSETSHLEKLPEGAKAQDVFDWAMRMQNQLQKLLDQTANGILDRTSLLSQIEDLKVRIEKLENNVD